MKKYFFLIFILLLINACSKKEEKFELFSPEAFAYSMDNGWELNAAIRVKGFLQNENGNKFTAKLSYYIDLQMLDGKVKEKLTNGVIDKTSEEKMMDIPIEIQMQFDSNYKAGNYKIIFHVKDEMTGKELSINSLFELSK
jgi:hypothetical protein